MQLQLQRRKLLYNDGCSRVLILGSYEPSTPNSLVIGSAMTLLLHHIRRITTVEDRMQFQQKQRKLGITQ